MLVVRADFESRSDVDLKIHGAPRYFASPHFRPLILAYKIDNAPIQEWTWPLPCPDDLREAIEQEAFVQAFNASFERNCFNWLADNRGWPRPAQDHYVCTQAAAQAMGLPRDLDGVATVLGAVAQKDKRGKDLINLFSKPRRALKGEDPSVVHWHEPEDYPDKFREFVLYCRQDVETEEAVAARLIPLSDYEQQVYCLDQLINARGIRIDVQSAQAAITLAEKAKHALDNEMAIATGGHVTAVSQAARLTEWIASRGVTADSVQKAELEDLLEYDDLPDDVRRAIEIRLEGAKASVAKLKAMLNRVSADGRVRQSFLYHAAGTGRWSSTGVQVHNLPRPRKEYEDAHVDQAALFGAIRTGEPALLRELYSDPLGRPQHLLADTIRGFIWSAPGHDLIAADYSGIEGAVAAWLAKEEWKVKALFEIAADPSQPDMYRRAAAGIFNTTTDLLPKKDPRRQVGKVSELALSYGGGVGAFVSMAKGYNLKLGPLYGPVWDVANEERRECAVKRYERCLKRNEAKTGILSREAWIACEIIKLGWRSIHPGIVSAWRTLEDAAREAIAEPGRRVDALGGAYVVRRDFLWRLLPSGRCLAYAKPKLTGQRWCLVDGDDEVECLALDEIATLRRAGHHVIEKSEASPRISAAGVDSQTRKFSRYGLYGGLFFENDCQSIARDLLVNGMFKAEAAGYPIVAHIHDDITAEVLRGFGDLATFEKLICELPPWALGLPLTASGWRGKRLRK